VIDPLTLIVIVVLAILLVWIVTHGGLTEPGRSIIIAVLAVALLFVILRLLGLW
jgi:hypothetical protein